MRYGEQVGVITLGTRKSVGFGIVQCRINARSYADEAKSRGLVPVWRDGVVTLHRAAPRKKAS